MMNDVMVKRSSYQVVEDAIAAVNAEATRLGLALNDPSVTAACDLVLTGHGWLEEDFLPVIDAKVAEVIRLDAARLGYETL